MITKSYIQFSMKWDKLGKYLDPEIIDGIKDLINNPKAMFPSVSLHSQDELAISLKKINVIIDGRNIFRIIRETIRYDASDIEDDKVYEFIPGADREEEIRLKGNPSEYYNMHVECEHCGRYKWTQKSDLQLKKSMVLDIDETESGEILISDRLKYIFSKEQLDGFSYRKVVGEKDVWQLIMLGHAVVKKPNDFLIGRNGCSVCGKPRIMVYEDTNGKELFKPPNDIPRIERTPILLLKSMPGDFSVTDIEFGTLGRLPEDSTQVEAEEFTHKTSKPKWVVSGKLCKILYKEKVKGFELSPAQIC